MDIWKHRNGAEGFGYPEDDLRSYADSQQRTLDLVGEMRLVRTPEVPGAFVLNSYEEAFIHSLSQTFTSLSRLPTSRSSG